MRSEVIWERRLADLHILRCFFSLSCNWFTQHHRHLVSCPSVSRALWSVNEEQRLRSCAVSVLVSLLVIRATRTSHKLLLMIAGWQLSYGKRMYLKLGLFFMYKSIAVTVMLARQFLS